MSHDTGYWRLLFPRIILTLYSAGLISFARMGGEPNVPIAMTGLIIFLVSSIYAQIRAFLRAERYSDDHDA